MFDETINTFLKVAKHGSFSKTAEELFLAPNAIIKRIKRLEEQTGIILFSRTNKGVTLTAAGESFYKEMSDISDQYHRAIEKAIHIQHEKKDIISVGMMSTFSDTFTMSNWNEVRKKLKDIPIHIVYYGSDLSDCEELFHDIGRKIDVCIDVYDSDLALLKGLEAKKISDFRLYIGFPDDYEIRDEKNITLDDLKGKKIALLKYGRAQAFDQIHDRMNKYIPKECIEEIQEYSIRTFNDCYIKRNLIVVPESLIDLYPFYKFIPFEVEDSIPFGIYYSKTANTIVKKFIEIIS